MNRDSEEEESILPRRRKDDSRRISEEKKDTVVLLMLDAKTKGPQELCAVKEGQEVACYSEESEDEGDEEKV